MKRKQFNVRFEELPALGEFVEASFLLDKDLFSAFSPVYANGFAENYHSKLQAVKAVSSPEVVTLKRKRVTENLYVAQDALIVITESIKRYCQLAGDKLTMNIDELHLTDLRKNLRNHNSEAAINGSRLMLQVLKPDLPVLEEHGFTAEKQAELSKLIDTMEGHNVEQNSLLNERKRLVGDNISLLNDFWCMIQDIMKTGQIIHRENSIRRSEYTEKNLRSRVRLIIAAKQAEVTKTPVEEPPDKEQPVAA